MMSIICLMKVQIVKYLSLGFEEINFVDFLGVENFQSSFPSQNFDARFIMLQEIIDTFWNKFMKFEKINKERVKIEFS